MFGLNPTHAYHLIFLLVPVAAWLVTLLMAKKRNITILHNSALAVSYWEEVLFRGLILGGVLSIWHNFLLAAIVSSLFFGLFHMRNLWWSSRKQVLVNCLYAGLVVGPLMCAARFWTGDIYLGIALHAIHNFSIMCVPTKHKPTNDFLLSKRSSMNWFEYVFSGFWLMRKNDS